MLGSRANSPLAALLDRGEDPVVQGAPDTTERDIERALEAMVARHAVKVPPYPAVALKLAELTKRESYAQSDVVHLVGGDPTLSADLLRCANSVVFARGAEVTSLPQAITRLGAREVTRLALTSALAATAQAPGPLQVLKRSAWQAAVASAVVCQELAALRGLPREDAFLCGLLHDFGRLIALGALDEILAAMPDLTARPETWWLALVDRVHLRLGLLLASRWKLPERIRDVIAHHHDPPEAWTSAAGVHAPFVGLAAAADAVVSLMSARSSVDFAALAAISATLVAERERAPMVDVIVSIPDVIAAFEGEGQLRPARVVPSAVASPDPLPEGFRRATLAVEVLKPKKRGSFTLSGIALGRWLMTGSEALAVNALIEVSLATKPEPLKAWAHVCSCSEAGASVRVECKAFALSGPALAKLEALFHAA